MKFSTFAKFVVVVGMGICSSVVTTQIAAQSRAKSRARSKGNQPSNAKMSPVEVITKNALEGPRAAAIGANPDDIRRFVVASVDLNKLLITAEDGKISISAAATMRDERELYHYMWNVRITNRSSNQVIINLNYDKQLLFLRRGVIHRPTFSDTFPLENGRYRVELRLFQLHENSNFELLKLTDKNEPSLKLGGSREVLLAD